MNSRRQFIKIGLSFFSSMGLWFGPLCLGLERAYAKARKKILPKGTNPRSLIHMDPDTLDTQNLEPTALKHFRTMGKTHVELSLDAWRLEIKGHVKNPFKLTYEDILSLPSIEKKVLLICPGWFANHGQWKGISMEALLKRAGIENEVTHVTFSGMDGVYGKGKTFPMQDILSGKVFLAYGVNGETLPKKHGFPLRVVAEGHYGDEWVKYVHTMLLEKR